MSACGLPSVQKPLHRWVVSGFGNQDTATRRIFLLAGFTLRYAYRFLFALCVFSMIPIDFCSQTIHCAWVDFEEKN